MNLKEEAVAVFEAGDVVKAKQQSEEGMVEVVQRKRRWFSGADVSARAEVGVWCSGCQPGKGVPGVRGGAVGGVAGCLGGCC
jgi:hypothetical protein